LSTQIRVLIERPDPLLTEAELGGADAHVLQVIVPDVFGQISYMQSVSIATASTASAITA